MPRTPLSDNVPLFPTCSRPASEDEGLRGALASGRVEWVDRASRTLAFRYDEFLVDGENVVDTLEAASNRHAHSDSRRCKICEGMLVPEPRGMWCWYQGVFLPARCLTRGVPPSTCCRGHPLRLLA